jgi:hypothetical protein
VDWEEEEVDPSTSVRLQNNLSVISQHKLVELFDFPYIVFESKVYRKRNIKESLEGKVS